MTRLTLGEFSRLKVASCLAPEPTLTRLTPPNCTGSILSPHPATGETVVPKATPDLTPVLEAQIATLRAVSELLRAQLTDTREECDRLRQKAERLALPPPAQVPEPLRRRRRRRWWQPAW